VKSTRTPEKLPETGILLKSVRVFFCINFSFHIFLGSFDKAIFPLAFSELKSGWTKSKQCSEIECGIALFGCEKF